MKYCPCCKGNIVVVGITGDGSIYKCNDCKIQLVIKRYYEFE